MTVSQSASQEICWQEGEDKSVGRFSDCFQIFHSGNLLDRNWVEVNLLADLVTVTKSVIWEIFCQKWEECPGRFSDCHQICQSRNLLEEMGEESAGRFSDSHQICQ